MRRCVLALVLALVACDGGEVTPDDASGMDGGSIVDRDAVVAHDTGGSFDAGPPEPCTAPGAIESVACGACGTVERFCTAAGTWAYGTCDGQGECVPGATDEIECDRCGTQEARCTDACTWEATGTCSGQGECTAGSRSRSGAGCEAGSTRDVVCSATCAYEPDGECEMDGCPTPGAIERSPCGSCGTVERFCTTARVWEYGECAEAGECTPGTTRSAMCGACGTRTERCLAGCTWDTGGACSGEGECFAGEERRVADGCGAGQTRRELCDVACSYQPAGACEGRVDAGRADAGRVDAGSCTPAGLPCVDSTECCTGFCFPGIGCL